MGANFAPRSGRSTLVVPAFISFAGRLARIVCTKMPAGRTPRPAAAPSAASPGQAGGPIDWDALRGAAGEAAARAYAPYSGLQVGAAGACEDGQLVTGCNVENASFGLTLCAECGLVSALVAGGHRHLVALSVLAGDGRPLPPCGRCRQILMEHAGPELLLDAGEGRAPQRLGDLLPGAFDRSELAKAAARGTAARRRAASAGTARSSTRGRR